jgi:Tol biopolymer transport system component
LYPFPGVPPPPAGRCRAFSGEPLEFSPDKFAIHVVAPDGTGRRRVAQGVFFSWSPDGRRIAFDSTREGNQDVWVVDLEGGEPERLTRHEADDAQPAW